MVLPRRPPVAVTTRTPGLLWSILLLVLLPVVPPLPAYADEVPAGGRWPLDPRPEVAARFDPPAQRWSRGHRGVDLVGRPAQPVRAALGGRVSFVGRVAGVGVVVVRHGATRTTYQPVAPSVSVGQPVAAGAVLGRLVWVGTHCAPRACLHWGWLRGSTYLDPLALVDAPGPVRLLPPDLGPLAAAPLVGPVLGGLLGAGARR